MRGLNLSKSRRDSLNRRIRKMASDNLIDLSEFKVHLQSKGKTISVWFVKKTQELQNITIETHVIEERQKSKNREYIVFHDYETLKVDQMNAKTKSIVFNLNTLEKEENRGWKLGKLRKNATLEENTEKTNEIIETVNTLTDKSEQMESTLQEMEARIRAEFEEKMNLMRAQMQEGM
ncbi:hypothetical protein E2R68_02330 [Psychromonas sp. RZ22]|nr:hypothetical protein E2R68_02330 [Psychromonas sp. RZ22]